MSKSQALTWAIVCGLIALCLAVIGLGLLAVPALMWGVVFISIYGYKAARDNRRIESARHQPQPEQQVIQMTSPGSHRLFVPPPLDK